MIKIIGMIMVLISSALIGYLKSLKYTLRRRTIRAILSSLNILITEITYNQITLSEAFAKLSETSESGIGKLFLIASQILNSNEGYTASEAWEIALDKVGDLNLNRDDIRILKSFGKGLGNSDIYNQEKNFKFTSELLKKQLSDAEELSKKNEKLYKNLGVLVGIAVIIIFL
ncbi:stage III sporulation protein SpoIIIAB [Thermoanaerobacterium sp. CMT5567-10]|uniref:stage III sporulation protein SpoIIIAB n=1 Tax=Thermoanaerobacterium sp. CMT5567-10 TaxID=3061989 RepID=UPI0026DFF071|nr:stage III sporulation protein SpoIIIAB [Thermoanaerobacterium sp. CMT5567-10]WKV08985.1 stage III sporulation protein SpoIIIAB [Thermoanaerobacterium sp. CMT5567-10]